MFILYHNDSGDIMNQRDLWLLFQHTGKIEYYLKYKESLKDQEKYDKKSRGNHR